MFRMLGNILGTVVKTVSRYEQESRTVARYEQGFSTVARTAFLREQANILKMNKFLEKISTFNFSAILSVKFREFGENVMHECENRVLHDQRNNWSAKFF